MTSKAGITNTFQRRGRKTNEASRCVTISHLHSKVPGPDLRTTTVRTGQIRSDQIRAIAEGSKPDAERSTKSPDRAASLFPGSTQVYTPIGRGAVRKAENRFFFLKIGSDPSARRFVKRAITGLEE
jgi:hypothetical protein